MINIDEMDPTSIPRTHMTAHNSLITVAGKLVFSSCFCVHYVHIVHRHTRHSTHIHNIKIDLLKYFLNYLVDAYIFHFI